MRKARGATPLLLVGALLAGAACNPPTDDPAPDDNQTMRVDTGVAERPGNPTPGGDPDPVAPAPPTPLAPFEDDGAAVCQVGQVRACPCPGNRTGTQVCVAANGLHSACGCAAPGGSDVLVPPLPPVINKCGTTTCAPFAEEETSVSARHCCTTDGRCGESSDFIFGAACVPRGGESGPPHPKCPDEAPAFLDLYGCCRSDGACGLTVDHIPNFDLGCVERSEIAGWLNAGSGQRDFLSLIFFLPVIKAEYQAIRCR